MKAVTMCKLSLIFLLLALLGGADALAADQPDTQPLIILIQSGGSGSAGGSGGGTGGGSGGGMGSGGSGGSGMGSESSGTSGAQV